MGADAGEAFDHTHLFRCEHPACVVSSVLTTIRRFDHECIAVPMATGVAEPLRHRLWNMRSAIERNDANIEFFMVDDHMVSTLENLEVEWRTQEKIRRGRKHGRPALHKHEAPVVHP